MEAAFLKSLQSGYSNVGSSPPPSAKKATHRGGSGAAGSLRRNSLTPQKHQHGHLDTGSLVSKVIGSPFASPNALARARHQERYLREHRQLLAVSSPTSQHMTGEDVSGMFSAREQKNGKGRDGGPRASPEVHGRRPLNMQRLKHDSDDDSDDGDQNVEDVVEVSPLVVSSRPSVQPQEPRSSSSAHRDDHGAGPHHHNRPQRDSPASTHRTVNSSLSSHHHHNQPVRIHSGNASVAHVEEDMLQPVEVLLHDDLDTPTHYSRSAYPPHANANTPLADSRREAARRDDRGERQSHRDSNTSTSHMQQQLQYRIGSTTTTPRSMSGHSNIVVSTSRPLLNTPVVAHSQHSQQRHHALNEENARTLLTPQHQHHRVASGVDLIVCDEEGDDGEDDAGVERLALPHSNPSMLVDDDDDASFVQPFHDHRVDHRRASPPSAPLLVGGSNSSRNGSRTASANSFAQQAYRGPTSTAAALKEAPMDPAKLAAVRATWFRRQNSAVVVHEADQPLAIGTNNSVGPHHTKRSIEVSHTTLHRGGPPARDEHVQRGRSGVHDGIEWSMQREVARRVLTASSPAEFDAHLPAKNGNGRGSRSISPSQQSNVVRRANRVDDLVGKASSTTRCDQSTPRTTAQVNAVSDRRGVMTKVLSSPRPANTVPSNAHRGGARTLRGDQPAAALPRKASTVNTISLTNSTQAITTTSWRSKQSSAATAAATHGDRRQVGEPLGLVHHQQRSAAAASEDWMSWPQQPSFRCGYVDPLLLGGVTSAGTAKRHSAAKSTTSNSVPRRERSVSQPQRSATPNPSGATAPAIPAAGPFHDVPFSTNFGQQRREASRRRSMMLVYSHANRSQSASWQARHDDRVANRNASSMNSSTDAQQQQLPNNTGHLRDATNINVGKHMSSQGVGSGAKDNGAPQQRRSSGGVWEETAPSSQEEGGQRQDISGGGGRWWS